MNPITQLNEFCHKNKLNFSFKLIKFYGPPHKRIFEACLRIEYACPENKTFLEFYGKGKTIKKANLQATNEALKKNIVQLLSQLDGKYFDKELIATCSTSKDVTENELSTLDDNFYDLYLKAEQNNLFIDIDFNGFKKMNNMSFFFAKLTIDNKFYNGRGTSDTDAIYVAVNSVKSYENFEKKGTKNFELEDYQNVTGELNILSQRLKKTLEYVCLLQIGIPQLRLIVYKCRFGNKIAYGLGKNNKIAKNRAAKKLVVLLKGSFDVNTIEIESLSLKNKNKDTENIKPKLKYILKSDLDAISTLYFLDTSRKFQSLKFIDKKSQNFNQTYFTVQCSLQHDLDFGSKVLQKENNVLIRNNGTFLITTSVNTTKKKARMESAEKMINLLLGKHPVTKAVIDNFSLPTTDYIEEEFHELEDIKRKDMLNTLRSFSSILLDGNHEFNPDYDYFKELKDLETEMQDSMTLEVLLSRSRDSTEDPNSPILTKCIININFGLEFSSFASSEKEFQAKNKAAYKSFVLFKGS